MHKLAVGEIEFIEKGIELGVRADGRGRLDYRPFTIETGIISQTNGSARIVLDATEILVGVKVEIGEPLKDLPSQGFVEVSVDLNPSVSPEFEGRSAAALNTEISEVMRRLLMQSNSLPLSELSLVPHHQCWVLYVDALILNAGGNLFDALSLAIRAALKTTEIPRVTVIQGSIPSDFELELTDSTFSLDVTMTPVFITFTRIGEHTIVDATGEEENCNGSRVTFGVSKDGAICGIQQGQGTIDPLILREQVANASHLAVSIITRLDDALEREEKLKKEKGAKGRNKLLFD